MNIFLCGLPGSGKTTIGKLVAKQLQYDFIDTDRRIEEAYPEKMRCREIHLKEGEEAFRKLEYQAFATLKGTVKSVIATGGGAVVYQGNIELMRSLGTILYLRESLENAFQNAISNGIPSYLNPTDPWASFEKLSTMRIPLYEKMSHFIIDTQGLTPREVANKICSLKFEVSHG